MKKLFLVALLGFGLVAVQAQEPKKCCKEKKACTEASKKECKDGKKACCKDKKACTDKQTQAKPAPQPEQNNAKPN